MADILRFVRISFNDRANAQLASSTALHFMGTDFDADAVTEWIEVLDLGSSPRPANAGNHIRDWTFQLNCYAKVVQGAENIYRPLELSDDVKDAFGETEISVVDWDQNDPKPEVGKLHFAPANTFEVDPVPATGGFAEGELLQVAVTVPAVFRDF